LHAWGRGKGGRDKGAKTGQKTLCNTTEERNISFKTALELGTEKGKGGQAGGGPHLPTRPPFSVIDEAKTVREGNEKYATGK